MLKPPITAFVPTYFFTSRAYKSSGQCSRNFEVKVWKTTPSGEIQFVGQQIDHSTTLMQIVLDIIATVQDFVDTREKYVAAMRRLKAEQEAGLFTVTEL